MKSLRKQRSTAVSVYHKAEAFVLVNFLFFFLISRSKSFGGVISCKIFTHSLGAMFYDRVLGQVIILVYIQNLPWLEVLRNNPYLRGYK
jgi:hypothetical protein